MEISTSTQAIDAARRYMERENFARFGYTPAVNTEHVRAAPGGFVVPWNSEAYLKTRDVNDMLAGNWPIFVDAMTGECRLTTREDLIEQ